MPSLYLYLIGGMALLGVGFGSGFYVDDRLNQKEISQLSGDLATAKANSATLGKAVDQCNASVDGIAKAGKTLTDAAQHLIDQANADRAKYTAAINAFNAIKSSDEKCPVAQSIIERAFQ